MTVRGRILSRRITALILVMVLSLGGIVGIGYANEGPGLAPHFHDETTTRSVVENTPANTNIGSAVSAHNRGTHGRYVLGGTDAESFSISSGNGQLKTKAALDYETKTSYTVTVTVQRGTINPVSDAITGPIINYSDADSITVTINVTDIDLNFSDGDSTTRSVQENSASNTHIGSAVTATNFSSSRDDYVPRGTDASSFRIDKDTGQKTRVS